MAGMIIAAALAAGLVGVSTLASHAWGHALGGIVSAFPLIVGPVLFLAATREDPHGVRAGLSDPPPVWELPVRMATTALLIVGLTLAAGWLGPIVAGILAALPTLASVLAVFTHAREGRDALLSLLRGMLAGLAAFVLFCAAIAALVEPAGVPSAFGLATLAAVLAHLVTVRLQARAPA